MSAAAIIFAVVGGAIHLVMGFFVAFSGLLAPPWAVVILVTAWLGLTVWWIRSWRHGPHITMGLPLLMLIFWFAFLTFGDLVLGWTA
ncbi:MAG: hypothetical protein ACN4GK_13105 [Acidimicrobiia bacterium]